MLSRAVRTCVRRFSTAPKVSISRSEALINNQWVKSKSGRTFETLNPANEEVLARVTYSGPEEVNAAVSAAQAAFYGGEWSKLTGYQRGRLLNRLADLIEKNKDELAMLEVLDNGKSLAEASAADLPLTIQCYRYYAGWADKIHGKVIHAGGPFFTKHSHFAYSEPEPVGVVGQIIPWNFPLLMQAWKLGPALAAGCSVVMKPAEQTPLSALRIGELLVEAGFPPGAVNILPGDGETGKLVATHPGIDKVAFTGSTEVGKEIMRNAASTLKRVTLELGGKSPMVVLPDADVEQAAELAHFGLFLNQGQCCCASSRVFVHEDIYDKFVQKSAEVAKRRVVGNGWESKTQQGPQVSAEQQQRVLGYINKGKQEGARLLSGGVQHGSKGFFVAPTVFADVQDNMTIAQEEIFGPVMSILKFKSTEEVLTRANLTVYGLAAAVVTRDFAAAQKLVRGIRAGTVWVNCYDTFDASLPFGGFKQSGIGRELGEAALANYLENKTVVFRT